MRVSSGQMLEAKEVLAQIEKRGLCCGDFAEVFRLIRSITAEFTPFEQGEAMMALEIIWNVCECFLNRQKRMK